MTFEIKCIAKRLSGGRAHEHIALLWWLKCVAGKETDEEGCLTREQMVEYIETMGDKSVWCPDEHPSLKGAWVHVRNNGRLKYVQTVADGRATDNLLSLPDR